MKLSKTEMLVYAGIFASLVGSASASGMGINNLLRPHPTSSAVTRASEIERVISKIKQKGLSAEGDMQRIMASSERYQNLADEYHTLIQEPEVRDGLKKRQANMESNRDLMVGGSLAFIVSLCALYMKLGVPRPYQPTYTGGDRPFSISSCG